MAEEGVDNNDMPPTTVAVEIEESSTEDTKVEYPPLNDNTKNDVVVNNTDILLPSPALNDTAPLLDLEPINNNVSTSPTVSPSVSSTEDTSSPSSTVHQLHQY
jgi:hypothetical protein